MKRFKISTILMISIFMTASWTTVEAQNQAQKKRFQRGQFRKSKGRRGGRRRPADNLKVGDVAPDFTLKSVDGKELVTLSSFKGKKPVLLVFGSYT